MDIIIEDSDIIEKNEALLIHLFFHLFQFDFRKGLFTNLSSIYDMSGCGFQDEDYIELSKQYYSQCPEHYTYKEGRQFYQKLSNNHSDNIVFSNFFRTYGFNLDKKCHLLKDIIVLLNNNFPHKNWESDNIFIIKTLDHRLEKEEELHLLEMEQQDKKIVKLPIRKKPSPEEIKNGYNEYLMVKNLGMNWEDAQQLAKANFEKKTSGKKFEPYLPEIKTHKLKI